MMLRQLLVGSSLALAGCWLATGPGMRWLLLREANQQLSVEATVLGAATHNLQGSLALQQLELADPSADSPKVKIDRLVAQFSPSDFCRRRLRIRAAAIQGAHFTDMPEVPTSLVSPSQEHLTVHQQDWFPSGLLGGISDPIYRVPQVTRFEDPSLEAASQAWMAKLAKLEEERHQVEMQLDALPHLQPDMANPLRDQSTAKQGSEQARALGDRLLKLQLQMEQLNQQFKEEQLQRMRQSKQKLIASRESGMVNSLDSTQIAHSMLIEMSRSILERMRDFSIAGAFPLPKPSANAATKNPPAGKRGTNIELDSKPTNQSLYLQKAKWNGDIRIGGILYTLEGRVSNVASNPAAVEEPSQAVCLLRNAEEQILVRTNLLPQSEIMRPSVEVAAEHLSLRDWQFTNQQGLHVSASGDTPKVMMRTIESTERQEIYLTINQSNVTFAFGSKQGASAARVAQQMTQALKSCHEWDCKATIVGDPQHDSNWSIECNLLGSLQQGLQDSLRSEIAEANRQTESQVAQLERLFEQNLDATLAAAERSFKDKVVRVSQRLEKYEGTLATSLKTGPDLRMGQLPNGTRR